MQRILFFTCLIFVFVRCDVQTENEVGFFKLSDVELLDGPFKKAQDADLNYILELEEDRLLAPFLREAGLTPKADPYPNWESSGLDGHIGGHYLSALSLMYAATGNEVLIQRLNYMLDELEACQKAVGTGFVGGTPGSLQMWSEIKKGDIRAGGFSLNDKWVPLYNIHKTYNGLLDAYLHTNSEKALEMLVAFTDWMIDVTHDFSEEQMQDMLRSEHGGLNEVFAELYSITKDEKHIRLAKQFSHHHVLDPLIQHEDKLTGMHANTQIPKVIGFDRIGEYTSEEKWLTASDFFWETVTQNRSVSIGGNSVREHFNPIDDFSSMMESVEGPETCNSYNMLKLTKLLFGRDPSSKYMDFYEKTLFNHILSTVQPETGGFVYFTPMRPGHYRVYSQPETSFWCCVGSGLENHAKYGEMIYAARGDELLVNLFISSKLNWKEKGMSIKQITNFPESEIVELFVEQAPAKPTTMSIRLPEWTESDRVVLQVNNRTENFSLSDGYMQIKRQWKSGDHISVQFPMELTFDQMPDHSENYSLRYGPIVLASPMGTEDLKGIYADDSRGGHIAHGYQIPLQEMPTLIGTAEDILNQVVKEEGKLHFAFRGQTFPDRDELSFSPFYAMHNQRYLIYFSQEEPGNIDRLITAYDDFKNNIAEVTLDLIYPGEQQPESDHGILFEDSEMGSVNGRQFRKAKGFFSYQVKLEDQSSQFYLLVRKNEQNNTAILINGNKIQTEPVEKVEVGDFYKLVYNIKLSKGKHNIRFEPEETDSTAEIYEVRFLK